MGDRGGRKRKREGRQGEMGRKGRGRKGCVERGKEGWREDAEKGRGRWREKTSNFRPGIGECSLAVHSSEERALGNKRRPWSPAGARDSGRASPAHSAPASAVGQPLLHRAPCAPPPASERSPLRPQTNYASENYRARPKGSRPRPCHPLPPYINPGCTMGPRMTDVCANNLRGSLADKRS